MSLDHIPDYVLMTQIAQFIENNELSELITDNGITLESLATVYSKEGDRFKVVGNILTAFRHLGDPTLTVKGLTGEVTLRDVADVPLGDSSLIREFYEHVGIVSPEPDVEYSYGEGSSSYERESIAGRGFSFDSTGFGSGRRFSF